MPVQPWWTTNAQCKKVLLIIKTTWLRRIVTTDSGWTTFADAYEIDKCWLYGNNFLENKKNTIVNTFWKEVVQSLYDLRMFRGPVTDYDYLSWSLWQDQVINLPDINKLKR